MYDEFDDEDDLNGLPSMVHNRVRRRERARSKKRKKTRDDSVRASRDAPTVGAVVIEVGPGSAVAVTATGERLSCVLDAAVRAKQRTALAVGDDVVVARDPSGVDIVVRVGPRRTSLSRLDPQNFHQERVVVANVDTVVVVGSAADPPLRPRLVDRYLVAIARGGAQPLVVVNKVDLVDGPRREQLAAVCADWRAVDVQVLFASASTGEGIEALLEAIDGQRCAFVGHSGVGKSSLVTALGSQAVAGSLAEHGRGRHTTSASMLHRLPSGAEVIDTPGVRQFGLFNLTRRELREAFTELAALAPQCGFADCTHAHEQDCAVVAAVNRGELSTARYDSYLRLLAQTKE
ncbi:MAG: ribosome small subunit-dependent GTPase A [Myxococcales bacterium]|nr:ribosome small subunit-dependent GTPase A [Myxococcales bacterium]